MQTFGGRERLLNPIIEGYVSSLQNLKLQGYVAFVCGFNARDEK